PMRICRCSRARKCLTTGEAHVLTGVTASVITCFSLWTRSNTSPSRNRRTENGRVRPAARQELATQAKPFLSRQASQRETGVEAHGGAEESQGISYRVALMQNSGV